MSFFGTSRRPISIGGGIGSDSGSGKVINGCNQKKDARNDDRRFGDDVVGDDPGDGDAGSGRGVDGM